MNATIQSVSGMGLVKIKFSKVMFTKFNLTNLNASNVDIWLAPVDNWHLQGEREVDIRKFNLTWNVTYFNLTRMEIQLNFSQPYEIS